jgi:hypothetical protein
VAWKQWADVDEWTDFTEDTFQPDVQYRAEVTLTASSGYTFEGVPADSFIHTGKVEIPHNPANEANAGVVTITFPVTLLIHGSAVKARDMDLSGKITDPVAGAVPAVSVSATEYTGFVEWKLGDDPHTGPFGAGIYTAVVTLTAISGYTFAGVTDAFFYNGMNLGPHVDNGDGTIAVTITFPTTAVLPISDVDLTGYLAMPSAGEARQTALTGTSSQWTAGAVTWKANGTDFTGNTFQPNTAYTATVTLTAETYYTFTGVRANAFIHSGAANVANGADSGVVTITFPATGPLILYVRNGGNDADTGLSETAALKTMEAVLDKAAGWAPRPVSAEIVILDNLSSSPVNVTNAHPPIILRGGSGAGTETIMLAGNGSLLTVGGTDSKVTLRNIALVGRSNNAPLIRINSGGTLTMENGATVRGNTVALTASGSGTSTVTGSGISVNGGIFVMNGGTITGNKATVSRSGSDGAKPYAYAYGGGVYMASGAFTMNGGTITGNTVSASASASGDDHFASASAYGSGVHMSGGTFTMSGGEISGNTNEASIAAQYASMGNAYGGGVSVNGGAFTMNGGTIRSNTANALSDGSTTNYNRAYGGGVSVNSGTFTVKGGEISGNTATTTGGNNSSATGGGVYGTFTNTGGTIGGNTPAP